MLDEQKISNRMKLIVLIPAFNEEKTISQVIRNIPEHIDNIDEMKILVVNDGSTDNTAKTAEEAGAFVVSHSRNRGLGIAFATGIKESLKEGADIIVNIDADGQFNPQDIPKLIEPILKDQADMVTASRFRNKDLTSGMSKLKKWGNKGFTGLINILTRKHFTDTQCGFRAYSREAALHLNLFGKFTYTQEVFLDLVNKGIRIKEVAVPVKYYKEREAKISRSLISYFFRAITIILRTFRDYKPLVFFGISGLIVFGGGTIFVFYSFVYWLIIHRTTPIRMYLLVGIALLVFGFLLIILALIADMLKRIRQNQEEILYKLKKKEYEKKWRK